MISISFLALGLAPAALALPNLVARTGPPPGTSVVPSVLCGSKTLYARGCYDELKSGQHALNHEVTSQISSPMTVDLCAKKCVELNYSIAGVMNGNQCWCDNAMSPDAPLLDAEQCDLPCAGDSTQVCGGTWHYEIYYPSKTGNIPNPSPPDSVGSGDQTYTSIGCYVDNTSNRTLSLAYMNSDNMTPAVCAAWCYSQNYRLAGVEWGRECYCGNDFVNPDLTALTECNQACSGDSTQTCGDEDRINVYSLDEDRPTGPSNPPRPDTTCGNNDREKYFHQGCYADNTRSRTLNQYSFSSPDMTSTMCSSKCYSKGYKYAGIENGTDCYCGNQCPRERAPLSHCSKTCGGDRKHTGGGGRGSGKLTVWKSYTLSYKSDHKPRRGFRGWS